VTVSLIVYIQYRSRYSRVDHITQHGICNSCSHEPPSAGGQWSGGLLHTVLFS